MSVLAFPSPQERFRALATAQVNSALMDDPEGDEFLYRQSRDGEELQGIAFEDQLAAIYTSPFFWDFCREVFPNNNVLPTERGEGAPQHFPDWFLFLLVCAAGLAGTSTLKRSVGYFRSNKNWRNFVADVHQYVPVDMTAPHDLPRRKNRGPRPLAVAGTELNAATIPLDTQRPTLARKRAHPTSDGPQPHHLDHFGLRWRGVAKPPRPFPKNHPLHGVKRPGVPFPIGHPYYGIRDKAFATLRKAGISQAHAMGILHPDNPFAYAKPDRNLFVGADGVVMKCSPKSASTALHSTGVGPVHGTKYTVFSTRISGQYMSRLIFDLVHTHKEHPGSQRDEKDAVLDVMPELLRLSKGGIRGLLVDSAVRGSAVTTLHRQGIRVINYPHAQSNSNGGAGRRLDPGRVEKSKLRYIASHTNHLNQNCEHPIFAVGGEFMELVMNGDGTDAARALDIRDYEHRQSNGVHRERLLLHIPDCAFGDAFDVMVPLFHDNPVSTAPRGENWGEVVRLYPPGSKRFKYLYGARNDTEARHADLKARVKHLPHDVLGQELRLLGAAMSINAIAWQVHLQAHGLPNVLDDTA